MKTAFVNIDSLVTINAQGAHEKIGAAMRDVGEIRNGAIVFDDVIRWIGPSSEVDAYLDADTELVDCSGKTVMPGFVDSHTHMVFAGSRSHEFARRLAGATYAEIAAEGGGILTTMRAVRDADVESLLDVGDALLTSALNHGTTTAEIKSGYGLDTASELRLLEAIGELQRGHEARVLGTFLGAHAVPPEWKHDPEGYVSCVINDMLPRVAEQGIATFCDVFVDAGFFTAEQGERVLRAGIAHGLRPKIHADEIALVGASQMAARVGAISADHLEHSTLAEITALRDAGVVCTLLPGTAYTLGLPFPDARTMIDNNAIVCLATDCNPGSSFSENMQLMLSLACMNMKMSIEEALVAATLHGARALNLAAHLGSLEVGKWADIVVYDVPSYKDVVYHFGVNHVWSVWVGGNEVV